MEYLNWEYTILARAVSYSNLSTAAANIGVSQPQISRIISKLEKELGVSLLDRDAKRKSSWTQVAYSLAHSYSEREKQFQGDISNLLKKSEPDHFRVASLEGLVGIASNLCHELFKQTKISIIEQDVEDLSLVETKFLAGDYDLIITSRTPGKKKFIHYKLLGYQTMNMMGEKSDISVMSSYEFSTQYLAKKQKASRKVFVSNSLAVRRHWIEQYSGQGSQPSEIVPKKPGVEAVAVYAIAQDTLSLELWNKIQKAL